MIDFSTPYLLRESHAGFPAGAVLFRHEFCDYGLASDDTRLTGVQHYSMTRSPIGDNPSQTFPQGLLATPTAYLKEQFEARHLYAKDDQDYFARRPGMWNIAELHIKALLLERCIIRGLLQGILQAKGVSVQAYPQYGDSITSDSVYHLMMAIQYGETARLRIMRDDKFFGCVVVGKREGVGVITDINAGIGQANDEFNALMSTGIKLAQALDA